MKKVEKTDVIYASDEAGIPLNVPFSLLGIMESIFQKQEGRPCGRVLKDIIWQGGLGQCPTIDFSNARAWGILIPLPVRCPPVEYWFIKLGNCIKILLSKGSLT